MSEDRQYHPEQLSLMREDISDIKNSMGKIADALTRLAVLEEKHTAVAQSTNKILERLERIERNQHDTEVSKDTIGRLFNSLDAATVRLAALELAYVTDKAETRGTIKTIKTLWIVVGGLVVWVGGKLLMVAFGINAAPVPIP